MYSNEIFTSDKENNTQMMTTLEIAEMMGMSHKGILRKLEGRTEKGKHIDGVLDILGRHHLAPSEFFLKSSYINSQNKEMPCYKCTRKGCEFLAHKFQGEKGIEFTIMYIERFHEMEQAIKQAQPQIEQIEPSKLAQRRTSSDTPIPRVSSWFKENDAKIKRLMRNMEMSRKSVYHEILSRLGMIYNLEIAKEIYKQENGFEPPCTMDMLEYFTELRKYTDIVIESLLFSNPDPSPLKWDW